MATFRASRPPPHTGLDENFDIFINDVFRATERPNLLAVRVGFYLGTSKNALQIYILYTYRKWYALGTRWYGFVGMYVVKVFTTDLK